MRLSHHLFSIFLAQAVALAASAPEAAPETDRHAPDLSSPIQELGRYLKRVIGLEAHDEVTYYGDYGAYGEYGSYGSYPDNAAESSSSESSASPTTTTTSTTTLTTSITLSMAATSTRSNEVSTKWVAKQI